MTDTRDTGPVRSIGNAERIGRALNGRRTTNGWSICCPVPTHGKGHGDTNPSLSISDGDDGRFLARCHAGCEFEDVIAALKERGLLSDDWRDAQPPSTQRSPRIHEPDDFALKLWREALPVTAGGIVDRYLKGRGILIDAPPTLRETCIVVRRRTLVPTMLVAVQIPVEGETFGKVVAIQKTALNVRRLDGSVYRGDRITHGSLGNGVVRLGKADDILGLTEGVENALSVMQLTGIPVWACLGAARMARVAIPESVRELHIFGDDDGPGREAAQRTADAHRDHIKVERHYPPEGFGDWNDALCKFYRPRGINDWNDVAGYAGHPA